MIEYKIPASVILAQAIFESNSGTSYLAQRSNNHFGIKCHIGWMGDTIVKTDDTLNECFRSYDNVEISYTDHSLFLTKRTRYASLFSIPLNDYKSWCRGLKAAGYATHWKYAEELIAVIEQNKLYEFDGVEKMENIAFQKKNIISLKKTEPLHIKDELSFCNSGLLEKNESKFTIEELKWILIEPDDEPSAQQQLIAKGNVDYYDIVERSEY